MIVAQRAVVAIERAGSYQPNTLRAAIGRVVEALGGWGRLVRPGDRVLVKPNCIYPATPDRQVMTHPAFILEVCRQLLEQGSRPFVGDSPAWGSLVGNLRQLNVLEDLRGLGVPVVEFNRPVKAENARGRVFCRLTVDAAALEADAIVNLPKLKTHRQLVLTAALKNMFGCASGHSKKWWHFKAGNYENYFGLMLVETFEMLRPVVTIMDAIVAMEGNGPISGTPRQVGLVMASTDGAALERVSADLVGLKPARLRTLSAARELGVGTPYLERIDVVGADLAGLHLDDFKMPKMMPIGFSLPRFVRSTLKQAWLVHQQSRSWK